MKKASLVIIRMWSANYNEKTKEVLSCDISMTYTVYHIRNQLKEDYIVK